MQTHFSQEPTLGQDRAQILTWPLESKSVWNSRMTKALKNIYKKKRGVFLIVIVVVVAVAAGC